MPRSVDIAGEPQALQGFLPDFCRIPLVFGILLTGQLLAIVLVFASSGPIAVFWERLGPLSLYIQIIALGGAALLCLLRGLLSRLEDRLSAIVAWLMLLAVTALVAGGTHLVVPGFGSALFPVDGMTGLMVRSLGVSAIVSAMLLRYLYLHRLWRRQVEAEANARFQTLQARIRPHFLFNSINTIANLTREDPDLAEELLQDLADLFRASLGKERATTLADELELSRLYLHIERQRLGERLDIEWDLEELPEEAELPPLTLQPLLENAVYHGVQPARSPRPIRISGRYRRGRINLSIRNGLPENPRTSDRTQGNRMAMDNVRQRLAAMYPGSSQLIESRIEGDYQVRLVFPYPWRDR
jgi:two-component system sensor histidine kinase AlgZ